MRTFIQVPLPLNTRFDPACFRINGCMPALIHHEENECPLRPVTCNWCERGMVFKELDEHRTRCDCRPVDCPWGCGAMLQARDLPDAKEHTPDCPNGFYDCEWNCGQTLMRPLRQEELRPECPGSAFHPDPDPVTFTLTCRTRLNSPNPILYIALSRRLITYEPCFKT